MRAVVVVAGLLVLLGVGIPGAAQDGPPPVETVVGYYDDENPASLGVMLYRWNVCFERFVTLNPDLEIDNIPYGTPVLLPKNEPCYDYSSGTGFTVTSKPFPRLKYYEKGKWLAEPYYSSDVTYESYNLPNYCSPYLLDENYGMKFHRDKYGRLNWPSFDIFIPVDAPICDPPEIEAMPPQPRLIAGLRHSEFSPLSLTATYNVCPEEQPYIWRGLYDPSYSEIEAVRSFIFWDDLSPCYNDKGQRLIYFDLTGHPLEQPEYSDLQVYRVQPGETMKSIAEQFGVCLTDLIGINYFADLPITVGEIEFFIPEPRACPDGVRAELVGTLRGRFSTSSREVSLVLDICIEMLAPLNPHLYPSEGSIAHERIYQGHRKPVWAIVPDGAAPCYTTYVAQSGESIFDIERSLNVCYEVFIRVPDYYFGRSFTITDDETVLYMRRDTPPCYNAQGQRLQYGPFSNDTYSVRYGVDPAQALLRIDAEYSELRVHIFGRADTVYSVSRQYNVCVRELLAANPVLKSSLPEGYPTFIPDTRPCYDEATGMPLIYEDENGDPLDEPLLGDTLIYYGTQPFGRVSYYYNVCQNRIEETNAAKLAGEAHYLGWIIPHDRPPCYDEDGYVMDVAMWRHVTNGGVVHTVQFAETLSEIAEQYDKSIYWIAAANDLRSTDMIWTDQKLIIPGGVTTRDVKLISAALIGLAAVGAVVMWRRNLTPRPPLP